MGTIKVKFTIASGIIALSIFQLSCKTRNAISEFTYNTPSEIKSVFSEFDFVENDYTLYATFFWSNRPFGLTDSIGMFYISGSQELKTLQENWKFSTTDNFHECGHDYRFFLTNEDSTLKILDLNLQCKTIISETESFEFESDSFIRVLNITGRLEETVHRFKNHNDAITMLNRIEMDTNYFLPYIEKYHWKQYPGYFEFQYFDKYKFSKNTVDSIVTQELLESYVQQDFSLESGGYGSDGIHNYKLYCDSSRFENFKTFEISKPYKLLEEYYIMAYRKVPITPAKN